MPEILALTDEQILDLPDSAESEISSESPETTSPVETQPEETAAETPLRPDQAKDETLTSKQQPAKAQQPAKDGTPEQAQEIIAAKAAELDRADAAFASGDVAGMAETFEQIFGDNPHACADALWMGLRFLEQRAPEHLSNFSKMVVSDELSQQGLWNALELIYESAQKSGAQETLALLDQLAGGLRQTYGIGPATPETQATEWQNYTQHVGSVMEKSVDADIARAFGSKFSAVQPAMQGELITAARLEVRDYLSRDRTLGAALQKLNQAYSVKEGVRIYFDVIEPRVRALVPRIVQNLANQHGDLFKNARLQTRPQPASKPAQPAPEKPRSMAEARAKGMTLGEILRSVEGEQETETPLGVDEAGRMSDMDILNSSRTGQRRAPWRPENVFDEANP